MYRRFTRGALHSIWVAQSGVLVSAPAKNVDRTIVYGVNHTGILAADGFSPRLLPLKLSRRLRCSGQLCGRAGLYDHHSQLYRRSASGCRHKDMYRARAAAMNMIDPGAARAVGLVLHSWRVSWMGWRCAYPYPQSLSGGLTFMPSRPVSAEAMNDALVAAVTARLPAYWRPQTSRLSPLI